MDITSEKTSEKPIVKTGSRYLLMSLLTILLLTFISFFVENTAYFDSLSRVPLSNTEYLFSFIGAFCMELTYFLAAKKFFHAVWKPAFLLLFALFFACGAASLLLFHGTYENGTLLYSLSASMRLRFLGNTLIEMVGVYLVFAIVPQVLRGSYGFRLFFRAFSLFMVAVVLYSYFAERSIYQTIIETGDINLVHAFPKSFTTNRNVYGMMLFTAIVGEAYLITYRPYWWRWLFIAFFYANELFILSKTALFVASIFIPLFYVYRYWASLKRHPIRNSVIFSFLLVAFATIIVLSLTGVNARFMPKLDLFFHSVWDKAIDSSEGSLNSRFAIWSSVFTEMFKNPITTIFGFGDYNFQFVLNAIFHTDPAVAYYPLDSSYVTIMAKFGVLGLTLYAFAIGYLSYFIVLSIKHKSKTWFYYLLTFLSFSAIGFAESHLFVDFRSQSVMLFLVLVLPLSTESHLYRKPEILEQDKILCDNKSSPLQKGGLDILKAFVFWLTPLFGVLFAVCVSVDQAFGFSRYSGTLFLVSLSLCFLLLPLIAAGCYRLRKKGNSVFLLIDILTVFYLAITFTAPLSPRGDLFVGLGVIVGVLIIVFLAFSKALLGLKDTLKVAWPYLLESSLLILALLLSKYAFSRVATPHLVVVYAVDALLLWLLVFVGFRKTKPSDAYFLSKWDRLERIEGRRAYHRYAKDGQYDRQQAISPKKPKVA